MNAKNFNKSTTPKKNRKPINVLSSAIASVLVLAVPVVTQAQSNNIIKSVTEDVNQSRVSTGEGGSACQKLENATSPVRAGQRAFKHSVERCGERSELEMSSATTIGETYWLGWSMYLPPSWQSSTQGSEIVMQLPAYPTNRNFRLGCGAVGSKMSISNNNLRFDFQHKGKTQDIQCDTHALGNVNDMKGKWVDFVMQSKWTGNTDGFLKLWMKVGNGAYVQKLNYTGPTFWNDEGKGPYFKMGLYKGDPDWNGPAPRVLYTDEYRLGNANSSFASVAPAQNSPPDPAATPDPPNPPNGNQQAIFEDFSSSANNFTAQLGGSWSINSGKYLLNSTNPGAAAGNNTNISVHKTPLASNFTLTTDLIATATSSSWDDSSLIFNYQDLKNYYYAGFNENKDAGANGIFKVSGGTVTQLASFGSSITAGSIYGIKVEKTGDTIKVYRNGTLQATAKDSAFTGGKVGFGSISSPGTSDNLRVN